MHGSTCMHHSSVMLVHVLSFAPQPQSEYDSPCIPSILLPVPPDGSVCATPEPGANTICHPAGKDSVH